MCAIVDANVAAEVFGSDRPEAGKGFFDWINKGNGLLVVGGKLLEELNGSSYHFKTWSLQARLAGKMRVENENRVNARTEELRTDGTFRSNDPHVLALAQVSGARLLYSNDGQLQHDFKNKSLIDNPRGKVYSTLKSKNFLPSHKQLLGNKDLCKVKQ